MADQDDPGATPVDTTTASLVAGARLAAALGHARGDDGDFNAFLDKQNLVAELQVEHLQLQMEGYRDSAALRHRHQVLRYFGDRLRVGLEVLGIIVGLFVVVAASAMVWQAHEDHGLVVDAFSAPSDFAQRGLTGEVLASRLVDRLRALQAASLSSRAEASYATSWGDSLKVQIPSTGVSIEDVDRYLRQTLGRQTHISGEVTRTPAGLRVTVRTGAAAGVSFEGKVTDLDDLLAKAAEALYATTQPFRYGNYLNDTYRFTEAEAVYGKLASAGPAADRAWGFAGWGTTLLFEGRPRDAIAKEERALQLDPDNAVALNALAVIEGRLSLDSAALESSRRLQAMLAGGAPRDMDPLAARGALLNDRGEADDLLGDYRSAEVAYDAALALPRYRLQGDLPGLQAWSAAKAHDVTAARQILGGALAPAPTSALNLGFIYELQRAQAQIDVALDDWPGALRDLQQMQAFAADKPYLQGDFQPGFGAPLLAYAMARTGDQAGAEALISATAADCGLCLRVRGKIAAAKGDWTSAGGWFAEAVRQAPDAPLAYADWGEMLLTKGDVDGAIAKLALAHQRGSRFADPLELWGEALFRKGDLQGAVAKFDAADKLAPRWGRNHLEWAEALSKLGRSSEARALFRAAAGMDLSAADRARLAAEPKP